jgi:hypothetical protein
VNKLEPISTFAMEMIERKHMVRIEMEKKYRRLAYKEINEVNHFRSSGYKRTLWHN